jgi:LacI family transcriptional regulator
MATIQDVANKANVSITTVSHVINGTRYVSDGLKERVYSAMDELHFRPNGLARSLRMGKTKTIGLIIPDNSNSFFAEMSRHIEDFGFQRGYSVILCNTDENPEKELAYIDVLMNKQVDGIIFIATGNSTENVERLKNLRIPIVFADREYPSSAADVVMVDNQYGGRLAAQYLLELGHTRFACIGGDQDLLASQLRLQGFMDVIQDKGLSVGPEWVFSGDFHFQAGLQCMDDLLAQWGTTPVDERPTAVFICNDMMALGAIRSIRKHGLSIPRDLSIIGFDNIRLAEWLSPSLTTVAQPIADLAQSAVDALLGRIEGQQEEVRPGNQKEFRNIRLKPALVIRDSCRAHLSRD